jgi:hypothetical protein
MKTKIEKMTEMLERAERVLARCQKTFPDTQKYDSIANGVSLMRNDILELLEDKSEDNPSIVININSLIGESHFHNNQQNSFKELEEKLIESLLNILKHASDDGASKTQRDNSRSDQFVDLLSEMASKAKDPEEKFMISKALCDLMKYRGYKKSEIVPRLQNIGLSGFTSINLYIQTRYKSKVETPGQKQPLHLNNSDAR